jgi:DNA-binding NarL/FixJ family response regulator
MAAPGAITGVVHSLEDARRLRFRRSRAGRLIRVLVVVDHAIHRAGLRVLLENDLGVAVVGETGSVDDAIRIASGGSVDVVLVDAECLELEAPALTRGLGRRTAVLVLIDGEADDRLIAALRAGAAGVLSKDSQPGELQVAVRTLAHGGALVPPHAARRLIEELTETTWAPAR